MRFRFTVVLIVLRLALPSALLSIQPAAAQMVLPGAAPSTPVGASDRPFSSGGGPPKPVPARVYGAEGVAAKSLWLNGGADRIVFAALGSAADPDMPKSGERPKKDRGRQPVTQASLTVTELKMTGDSISHPGQDCRIDIRPDTPVPAKPLGLPAGLLRYQLELPACTFSFDVLDGSILTTAGTMSCSFSQADCKVNPSGLWGPLVGEFTPERDKSLERERTAADAAEFLNFKTLVARTKDRALVKTIAAGQAAFSSRREETCRSYAQESAHGYCATRVTQARAAELQNLVNLSIASGPPARRKKTRNAVE